MARYTFGGSPKDVVLSPSPERELIFAPETELTFWSDAASGDAYTDLLMGDSGSSRTSMSTDSYGRIPRFQGPDGVVQMWVETQHLSGRVLMVASTLGDAVDNKLGQDEAPHAHSHVGSDMPSIQRGVDQLGRLVFFDVANNRWPYQSDITATYPAVPVFWYGNATVPAQLRKGLDYLDTDPLVVPVIPDPPTPPTEEPVPDPDDPDLETGLAIPTVVASGASVSVTTTLTTTGGPQTFAYAQVAVRGPSGQNRDLGYHDGVTVNGTLTLSGTFTADVSGTWTAYGTYNKTGGGTQDSWTDGPKKTFTVTIPTPGGTPGGNTGSSTPGKIADIHSFRSKLPWNSGAFVDGHGYAQWNQPGQTWFGGYRGRPSDVMLVFNDGAANWDGHDTFYDSWKGWPGIFVWTLPPQPKSAGGNQATASGANNGHWDNVGQNIVNAGMNNNRMVLRLGHECNGNWYPWAWGNGGGASTFIQAFKNCVTRVRAKAPNILINICLNKDWDGQGGGQWQDVLNQLKDYIDIVGLDAYDLAVGFRNDQSRKNAWYNKSGPQRNSVAAWCRANGKMISLDEWGLIALNGENGSGGGDDVLYITDTYEWCKANSDILAYESYFMAPGNPGYEHELDNYPQAEAAYRSSSRWGNL